MRAGLLVRKMGMSHIFDKAGGHVPVTLLSAKDCVVTACKTQESDGYEALQVGIGPTSSSKLTKTQKGIFEGKTQRPLRKKLVEFRVSSENMEEIGKSLQVDRFKVGALVDVSAISKGKGFQGGMKRWGFGGLRASHGVSVSHRSLGSTGQRSFPGRVFKNKKMAGHMGHTRVTAQNLEVVFVDVSKGWLGVRGCVPGAKGGAIVLRDAIKVSLKQGGQS